uniref:C2 PI3K-type domain-containing protein n=1 Tax=Macrostomum lignano TaxID=282301 RepID=A0A1I8FE91_9PLAT
LTVIGTYGPDGCPIDISNCQPSLANDVISSAVAIATRTPMPEQPTYLSAGNIEMQIDINEDRPQIYSAVAESCSMVAKYSFVNSREADSPPAGGTPLCTESEWPQLLLTRFAALQIMSPDHWQEEAPSLLGVNPPQNPLVRLRMWRHIGADKLNELTLAVSVAALDSNGGFANSTQLPWPSLMLDVEYFTRNTRNDHEMDELETVASCQHLRSSFIRNYAN